MKTQRANPKEEVKKVVKPGKNRVISQSPVEEVKKRGVKVNAQVSQKSKGQDGSNSRSRKAGGAD